jgi:hypothetical protein
VLFDFDSLLYFNAIGRRHMRKRVVIATVEISIFRFVVIIMRGASDERGRWWNIGRRFICLVPSATATSAATRATRISTTYAPAETPQR